MGALRGRKLSAPSVSLQRFLEAERGSLFAKPALDYLRDQLPPAFFHSPLESSPFLRAEPASKTLLPEILARAGVSLAKSDYYLLGPGTDTAEEIATEVVDKLNAIQALVSRPS